MCAGILSKTATASVLLGLMVGSGLRAEEPKDEFALGKAEYLAACAACHGEAADGNGPIATMFKSPVPGLTDIAKRHDGVFPFLDIFHIVDGRTEVRAHGNPMPVFGNRYSTEAGEHGTLFGSETQVRGRVTELVLYLESIQQ